MLKIKLLVISILVCGPMVANAGLLYAVREADNTLVSIDTNTLDYSVIGATGVGGNFGGMAYDFATATMYWIAGRGNENLYSLNLATGVATLIGSHGINDLFGLEFDSSTGTLYASQFSGGSGLYTLDTATGAATVINPAMTRGIGGLAYDSSRDQLVGVNDGAGDLYVVDRSNGGLTLLFDGDFTNNSGLAYDNDLDLLWDIDWSGFLYSYDPNAGYTRTTRLSGLGAHDGMAYVGSAPPRPGEVAEPGTLGLLGLGLAALGLRRRSKKV